MSKGMLYGLDLFSGIGGNTLGLRQYVKTIAYCEQDRHAQSVLLSRMGDRSIEPAPIWDDVTTLRGAMFDHPIDIIVGGFPCQDISVAGNGSGLDGERSGLVFEIFRLVGELKPAFVFMENVPAIRTRGAERVVKELAALGYDCRWDVLSAFDVGAPHKRDRWFLLARRSNPGCEHDEQKPRGLEYSQGERGQQERRHGSNGLGADVADTDKERWERRTWPQPIKDRGGQSTDGGWWSAEPDVGRMADGIPHRMDRIKRLGNAVVPSQAREAFERLAGMSDFNK